MYYKDWKSTYEKILKDFNFSLDKDHRAADILNGLLKTNKNLVSINTLNDLIKNKELVIAGAGVSLESSIIRNNKKFIKKTLIAADGTTSALLKNNIYPDFIVTDLDGNVRDQIMANKKGSITIIHAHGDNIDKIKKYVPQFKGEILGTTQTNPDSYDLIYNFGGFTDGDRSAFLAVHFNAKKIYLMGFDFNEKIGKYSYSDYKDKKLKLKKLKWCEYLINMLKNHSNIFNL